MLVSVVIPCYNSEKTIKDVVEMTISEFDKLEGYECEFVLVNDCSQDGTFQEIKKLGEKYPQVHGINLIRNFGQHNALMCAMNYAKGKYILGMDDDFQTYPTQIPFLVHKIEEGYDLVYGIYKKRVNSPIKNFTSWLNKVTSRVLLGRPKDIVSSNFWIITDQVKDEVIKFPNYNPYVDAIFYRTTHNVGNVEIEHHKREYGDSNYTLWKLIKLWLAYFNYTVIPLRLVSVIGTVTAICGFIGVIVTVVKKLLNPVMTVGWSSIVSIMLFFFGMVLLVLGVIGEYIGDIVLAVNNAPQFIVRDKVNL